MYREYVLVNTKRNTINGSTIRLHHFDRKSYHFPRSIPTLICTRGIIELSKLCSSIKVREKAKFRTRYNQVPHPTQDTMWERDKSTRKCHTQESQEASPFPTGDHKSTINRHHRRERHTKRSTKEAPPWNDQ